MLIPVVAISTNQENKSRLSTQLQVLLSKVYKELTVIRGQCEDLLETTIVVQDVVDFKEGLEMRGKIWNAIKDTSE